MSAVRAGEVETTTPIRSERFFKLHDFWFFTTREGTSVGPFDSKHCAEVAVSDYIEFIHKAGPEALEFFKPGVSYAS